MNDDDDIMMHKKDGLNANGEVEDDDLEENKSISEDSSSDSGDKWNDYQSNDKNEKNITNLDNKLVIARVVR